MAIARRIVEAHGGSIESGGRDGRGAEIVIVLPRRAGPRAPTGGRAGPSPESTDRTGSEPPPLDRR